MRRPIGELAAGRKPCVLLPTRTQRTGLLFQLFFIQFCSHSILSMLKVTWSLTWGMGLKAVELHKKFNYRNLCCQKEFYLHKEINSRNLCCQNEVYGILNKVKSFIQKVT